MEIISYTFGNKISTSQTSVFFWEGPNEFRNNYYLYSHFNIYLKIQKSLLLPLHKNLLLSKMRTRNIIQLIISCIWSQATLIKSLISYHTWYMSIETEIRPSELSNMAKIPKTSHISKQTSTDYGYFLLPKTCCSISTWYFNKFFI